MTKKEIKKVPNNELIVDYVRSYSLYEVNYLLDRGRKQVLQHCHDLEAELVARNILTEDDVKHLNS